MQSVLVPAISTAKTGANRFSTISAPANSPKLFCFSRSISDFFMPFYVFSGTRQVLQDLPLQQQQFRRQLLQAYLFSLLLCQFPYLQEGFPLHPDPLHPDLPAEHHLPEYLLFHRLFWPTLPVRFQQVLYSGLRLYRLLYPGHPVFLQFRSHRLCRQYQLYRLFPLFL